MLLRMLVLMKILIRHSIRDETKRINRNSSLFGNIRMFWPRFIDLQNFILLVRTVPFFREINFISSYTEKNNYFLLYELIQYLPYAVIAHIAFYAYLTPYFLPFYANFQRFISDRWCSKLKRTTVLSKGKTFNFYEPIACFGMSIL